MSRVVTGAYRDRDEAEAARADLAGRVALLDSAVVTEADDAALARLGLPAAARAAGAAEIARGAVLLLARVEDEATADAAIAALSARAASAPAPTPVPAGGAADGGALRIGEPALVRGGARVDARLDPPPDGAPDEAGALIGRRAAGRRLSEEEVARAGLLTERVVEIGVMREEALVSKQAFVREELVVRKQVDERVEQVEETLRRTEVEVERFAGEPGGSAFGFDGAADRQGR